MAVTWNPLDKNAGIALSNGDKTAQATVASWKSARATLGREEGRYYFEGVSVSGATQMIGIATFSVPLTGAISDIVNNGWAIQINNSTVYKRSGGVYSAYGNFHATGDVYGVALDLDSKKIWFRHNGAWLGGGDPATGTLPAYSGLPAGLIYPACSLYATSDKITLSARAGDVAYAIPDGFLPWDEGVKDRVILSLAARARLNTPSARLSGSARLALTARGDLVTGLALLDRVAIRGVAQCGVVLRTTGNPLPPQGLWAKLDGDRVLVVIRERPDRLRLTAKLDGDAAYEPVLTWENPDAGLPAILSFAAPDLGTAAVSRILTLTARAIAGDVEGPPAAVWKTLQAAAQPLPPPAMISAALMRQFSPYWRDLTRITWHWGGKIPTQVQIKAYIRPRGVSGWQASRRNKNLLLGIASAEETQFFVEGLGMKILTDSVNPEPVYFGLAGYRHGETGPELITEPIEISAKVDQLDQEKPPSPDELAGTAVHWDQAALFNAIASATGSSSVTIQSVMNTALVKIKQVISQGGSVDLDNVGVFSAYWTAVNYRTNRITQAVTVLPAERQPRFKVSPGFRVGVERGLVLTDEQVL